ncbi:MAG: Swt1 family HEPN domain-containing protein [Rhodospirillaceae bacterium]|nr:Swt1 family HEPN domain-containing protein [Rhodospirillaceae bacterium]
MNDLLSLSTHALARCLNQHLSRLSPDWWRLHVINQLTDTQRRTAAERRWTAVEHLDLAALLKVLDANWFDLAHIGGWPRDGQGLVKELRHARNRWAHQSASGNAPDDTFRDADTVARLLKMIGAPPQTITAVTAVRDRALRDMSSLAASAQAPAAPRQEPSVAKQKPQRWRAANTLEIGRENKNGQVVTRKTDQPGTDHLQKVYVLTCKHCGHTYGANGSDAWQRKCPKCQAGRPGLAF